MPISVTITLTAAGAGTGPFNLFSDTDSFTNPFEGNIGVNQLTSGYTSVVVPTGTTVIRVKSAGICTNYVDLPLTVPSVSLTPSITVTPSATPTVTPTVTPTISITPSPTLSVSVTPSQTPSISITPTLTPTISVTPSISITPSVTLSVSPTPPSTDVYLVYRVVNIGGDNYDLRFTLSNTNGSDSPSNQITVGFDIGTLSNQDILYSATCGAIDVSGTWYLTSGTSTTTKPITCTGGFNVSSVQLDNPPFIYNSMGGYFEYTYLGTPYRIYITPAI